MSSNVVPEFADQKGTPGQKEIMQILYDIIRSGTLQPAHRIALERVLVLLFNT